MTNQAQYGLAKIGGVWMIMNLTTFKTYRENGQEWSSKSKNEAAKKIYTITTEGR